MKLASIKLYTVNFTKADPYYMEVSIIEDGVINETTSFRFNIGNADIEGPLFFFSSDELRTGPSFADQWDGIRALFSSCDYLCCYRQGDDFNALYQSIRKRELPFPSVYFFDVQGIARRMFVNLPDYQYRSVASELGISVPKDMAFEFVCDSKTTGQLALKIIEREDIGTIEKAFEMFEIIPGRMDENGYQKQSMTRKCKFLGLKDPKAEEIAPDPNLKRDPLNFFYGKNVVFTGSFKEWGFATKRECQQLIANIGGYNQKGLNAHTNILIEGIQTSTKKVDGIFTDSDKQKKAREMKAKGMDIEIIPGDVFLDETLDYRIYLSKL